MRTTRDPEKLEAHRILDYVANPELAELDGIGNIPDAIVFWALRKLGEL